MKARRTHEKSLHQFTFKPLVPTPLRMAYNYRGELDLACDGPRNLGALSQLVDLVANSIDYSKCRNDREKSLLKANTDLALSKIRRCFTPRIVFANFEIKYLVGFGSYGRIWMSNSKSTGDVAIKQMPATLESCAGIWKERDIMIYLKHPRICNLVGAFYYSDAFLVMELCYGSVAALRKKITPENAVRFSMHLLQAVKWIHSKNVVHADLKPDNCLIKTDNTLVVSDFGSSFILENDQNHVVLDESHGSHGYQDYQALKFFRFSKETDIFATACIIFEMDVKGTLLFYHSRQSHPRSIYIDAIENGRVIGLSPSLEPNPNMEREPIADRALCSQFGWLLQKMIRDTDRITAEQAIEDSSFRSVITETRVSLITPSKRKDYVTREFNYDTSKKFAHFNQNSVPAIDTSFLCFYYDELDVSDEFVSRVPVVDPQDKDMGVRSGVCSEDESDGNDVSDEETKTLTPKRTKRSRFSKSSASFVSPNPSCILKVNRFPITAVMNARSHENSQPMFSPNDLIEGSGEDDTLGICLKPTVVSKPYVADHPDLSPLRTCTNSSMMDQTDLSPLALSRGSYVESSSDTSPVSKSGDQNSLDCMED